MMVDERKRLLPPRLDDQEVDAPFTCCFPRTSNKTLGKASILLALSLERIAFYSLTGNLILFLNGTEYQWDSYYAAIASYVFLGISSMCYCLGGIFADVKIGRFKAILCAFVIYLLGYAVFTVISQKDIMHQIINKQEALGHGLVYVALAVVGLGTGLFKANIAPFGIDQLKGDDPRSTTVFFNWYYWSINIGTLIALGGIAFLQQSVKEVGFFWGYLVATCCLFLGLLVFMLGKCAYVYRKPAGSYFITIFKIIREAWRIRKRKKAQYEHKLNASSSIRDTHSVSVETAKPVSFLDHAKFRYGGSYHDHSVDDIKKVGKVLLVFLALVPYWMVYYQIETTFLMQGLHMKLSFGSKVQHGCNGTHTEDDHKSNHFNIAVAWLFLFDVVLLIILIPIMDRIIYPWIRQKGWNFSMDKRMILGLFFATLAILVAGFVEKRRLQGYWVQEEDYGSPGNCNFTQIQQKIQNTTYNASTMSILWQIPQSSLIGLSEIFTSITGLEFASLLAPKAMKSSVMGLFYFFSGLGSFVSMALLACFYNVWFWPSSDHGNINCRRGCSDGHKWVSEGTCHLDYYFYVLGGIQALGALFFIFLMWKLNLQNEIKLGLANSAHVQRGQPERPRSARSGRIRHQNVSFTDDTQSGSSSTTEAEVVTPRTSQNLPSPPRPDVTVKRTIPKDSKGRIGGTVHS